MTEKHATEKHATERRSPDERPAKMRAYVVHAPGGPEALTLESRPLPEPAAGQVRLRVKAVGVIDACPSGRLPVGIRATAMGGLGRAFDGSYADYVVVPEAQVQPIDTGLPWAELAALPEMVQTAYGALHRALDILPEETLVVRGATSSVGQMAVLLAKRFGCRVIATTRDRGRVDLLHGLGADVPLVDDGSIAHAVRDLTEGGADKVLDFVGTPALADNLAALRPCGTLCLAGILSKTWTLETFSPMFDIPSGRKLTSYVGDERDFMRTPIADVARAVEAGELTVPIAGCAAFTDLPAVHARMEANERPGKWVVLVDPALTSRMPNAA